ncbi:hypothetical protein RRG08_037905 [Elysia crispata]|uniref:Cilia- and flagella-associated protein 44 n=1 Tax=Elysia crispata TaxID=231223 RepID=A0AAE0ZJS9_9GAST|nr:hypothetical protein RRG08_037905 [Elysia crispata]
MADEETKLSTSAEEKPEVMDPAAEPQSAEVAPPLGEAPDVDAEKPAETDEPGNEATVPTNEEQVGVNEATNQIEELEEDGSGEQVTEQEDTETAQGVDPEEPQTTDENEAKLDETANQLLEPEQLTNENEDLMADDVEQSSEQEDKNPDLSQTIEISQEDVEKSQSFEADDTGDDVANDDVGQQQLINIIEEAVETESVDATVAPPMIDGQEEATAEVADQQAAEEPQQEQTAAEGDQEQSAAAEGEGEATPAPAAESNQEQTAEEAGDQPAAVVQQEESAPAPAEGQDHAEAEVKTEEGEGQIEEQKATEEEKVPEAALGETDFGDTASKGEQKEGEEGAVPQQQKEDGEEEEKKTDGKEGDEDQQKKDQVDGDKKDETEGQKEVEEGREEGDETEKGEEKKKKKDEEEETIPEDFYYNFEEHASKAVVAQDSGLPLDMLAMQHSYGYDCKKRNNLHLLDDSTVVFAAGNLLQILNLKTRSQTYLRSTSGCGIGAICVHPSRKYFAVGEKGEAPNINIFEFPSLKLYRIMRGGTEQSYTSLTFSPDGELLASQGGEPDFMLTVWNWRQEKTTLRTKSFSQDVYRVSFAPELEGQLTTAGSGHIRFWKMADTFTGLKLQGELGRFGRTEISDIEGYVELPDGKVLSGAEWGNLLLWDGGLIKVEITTKSKKNCHNGPIMQILLDEGELMTVGSDGFIRVWDFEAIDTADSTDETGLFHMDPMNELQVGAETGDEVHLYTIVKSVDEENEPTIWYAQDANGGIWRLDLSFSHTSQAPEKLFTFHAGSISGCVSSPLTHLAVSAGLDKTVRAFDYIQMKQLAEVKFSAGGTCIEWVPLTVDTKGSSVVVGFQDGVVRSLTVTKLEGDHSRRHEKQEAEIVLKQAFKPHNGPVTAMAFDGKGEVLATGSSDGTVFFLYVSEVYDPIGFIKVPGAVRQLVWTPEKFKRTALMVVCEDGVVVEVDAPEPGNFDTSHTYEISGLSLRSYKFKSIKSHLRHEEELERERIEEEERKKKEEEERRKRIERGLETESEAGDEEVEQKPKTPKPEWHPYIPEEPSPILNASYAEEEGQFWLSMGEFDAGYLYKCKFTPPEEQARMMPDNIDKPLMSVAVHESNDVPIHVIKYSQSGQRVMFGMANGQIRIQQLEEPHDLAQLGPQWTLSVHDNNYGHITALASSFDGSMVLSTGADGNFFQFSFMSQEAMEEKIKENKARLPSAKELQGKVVDDIDDPNAYSIEDAKQKTEHDKRMKEAEQKKRDVRKKINQMRRQFKTILEQNENMPKHLQLSRQEFEMDREIKQELHQQTAEKVDLVRRELAWDSEKLKISLEKLRKRFKDVVECERIVVRAFTTPHEVTSFRASKLSDDFYQLKADFERRKTKLPTKDDFSRDPTKDLGAGQRKLLEGGGLADDGLEGGAGSKVTTTLKGSMGERVNNALQKVEEKKKKRAARRALWEELYSRKPDDDYEDPQDVAAIKEAQENMGDYKLKTAADYVVPDHLRMNVDKARGRLLSIKDMIHEYKYDFNVRLLALRDRKIQVIDQIRDIVTKLHNIQTKLQQDKHLPIPPVPELHADEMPERILEYTRETLKQFKVQYDLKQKQAKTGGGSGGGDGGGFGFGFGGGDSGGAPPPAEKQPTALSPPPSKQPSTLDRAKTVDGGEEDHEDEDGEKKEEEKEEEDTMTPLERKIYIIDQIRLEYEQGKLLQDIREVVARFDAELRIIRHDKFRMDIVMKDADLRQVTLFEELVLLKEYEIREDILAEKVANKQQEKLDMQSKMLEVQGKIDSKKKDIEKLQEKEKSLMASFTQSLGENNKFADYLTKVFKKRVKRTKKKMTEEGESDEDSDEDSSDDSDWEESDEESESEVGGFDLDVCPPGCDQKLYDDTCTLREKRLDNEEALAEEKKNQDAQKKELESLQKKAKVIDSQLKTAQNDLEDFQLEKQQKLNELTVVATLKLHQVQHVTNGGLHHDLSPTLVFASGGVVRLQHRIKELEHEKLSQKKQMRESRKKHVQLIKDRRIFEAQISDMEETCSEMMLAKFGCMVDLEKIETVTVNRAIEELKEKLRQTEIDCSMELQSYDEEIMRRKERITNLVRDNTQRLTQLAMMLKEQNQYTDSLDNRQKKVGADFTGQRKTDVREKQRLIQLVQLQAQEIDALKEEIMLLSRKGGHILPPAQPPTFNRHLDSQSR